MGSSSGRGLYAIVEKQRLQMDWITGPYGK